jgi:ketosteroid isomerase-like protein
MKGTSVLLGLALSLAPSAQAQTAAAQAAPSGPVLDDQQKAVWQGEVDYWKHVNGRDMKGYLSMWYPDFTGWPCDTAHPANLADLAKWADQWFAEKTRLRQVTTPQVEAVVVDRDFAITYLSARTDWTDVNGAKQSKFEKFVHTWKATDHGWKIMGGMCAPLTVKPAS